MKRLLHDSLAQAGFFQKKEPVPRICKPVPVLFLESVRATSENRFCPRPVVPDEAASARMMQPEDIATCALLALQFRARAVIEGLIIRSR
jgi:hypothetical protein